jgi:hypothetical protein
VDFAHVRDKFSPDFPKIRPIFFVNEMMPSRRVAFPGARGTFGNTPFTMRHEFAAIARARRECAARRRA